MSGRVESVAEPALVPDLHQHKQVNKPITTPPTKKEEELASNWPETQVRSWLQIPVVNVHIHTEARK